MPWNAAILCRGAWVRQIQRAPAEGQQCSLFSCNYGRNTRVLYWCGESLLQISQIWGSWSLQKPGGGGTAIQHLETLSGKWELKMLGEVRLGYQFHSGNETRASSSSLPLGDPKWAFGFWEAEEEWYWELNPEHYTEKKHTQLWAIFLVSKYSGS